MKTTNFTDQVRLRAVASSMILLIALSLMVLVGCDDGNPETVTVTFTLEKVSATSFKVTVDGANWNSRYGWFEHYIFDSSNLTASNPPNTFALDSSCDYTLSGKVITATLGDGWSNLAGTLKFRSDLSDAVGVIDREMDSTYTFVGKPAEGITF